ncbi:MAG: DUF1874 domain-containing protein [Methanosphaera sp.]|nr:DUF1874 domain-containing protein [Methanosphaera sp.]MBR0471642.1 DUF1874 domain-containing protein [Methanosphaera sp.]
MKYIINAFSTKMIKKGSNLSINVKMVFEDEVLREKDNCISVVGHHNLAEHLGIPRNRISIMLEKGDIAYLIESSKFNNHVSYYYKKLTVI